MGFRDYDATPASNTDINGIDTQGTAAVSNFDNALRQLMADAKAFSLLTFTSKTVKVLTSGTTYTPDAEVVLFDVTVVGAGGGGGGADGQGSGTAGSGGPGAGGAIAKTFGVTPGASYTYSIGTGGSGGSGAAGSGGDGTNSTFSGDNLTNITAAGGLGGGGRTGTSGNGRTSSNAGGTVSAGGEVNVDGALGYDAIVISGTAASFPHGADGEFGRGGKATQDAVGGDATGYGAGGAGGMTENVTANQGGGDGSGGVIYITEYRND